MRDKNPEMGVGERKKFVMRPPQVVRVGSKKTAFANFMEIAKMLHTCHDSVKDKPFELELAWVCAESGWEFQRVPDALRDEADAWAKQKIEEAEMDDDSDSD